MVSSFWSTNVSDEYKCQIPFIKMAYQTCMLITKCLICVSDPNLLGLICFSDQNLLGLICFSDPNLLVRFAHTHYLTRSDSILWNGLSELLDEKITHYLTRSDSILWNGLSELLVEKITLSVYVLLMVVQTSLILINFSILAYIQYLSIHTAKITLV